MNGRVLSISENSTWPPAHPHCRCAVQALPVTAAGTATFKGVNGADYYIKTFKQLPSYYISKSVAKSNGWKRGTKLDQVVPAKMVGGDEYIDDNGILPSTPGRKWYEADINYVSGTRNSQRILYSNDGLVFVTYDHYRTFIEIK